MNALTWLFERIGKALTWWVIVAPWEMALRVRWGHRVTRLNPGIHFKVPVVDLIYKQSVRLRSANLPVQTITTRDGKALTISAMVNYAIADLEALYQRMHHAEDTLRNLCMAALAAQVQESISVECTPESLMKGTQQRLWDLSDYGIAVDSVCITDFAFVRTHRLIMGQKWDGIYGDALNTTTSVSQ